MWNLRELEVLGLESLQSNIHSFLIVPLTDSALGPSQALRLNSFRIIKYLVTSPRMRPSEGCELEDDGS